MKFTTLALWAILSFYFSLYYHLPSVNAQAILQPNSWNMEWNSYTKDIRKDNLLLVLELSKQRLSLFKKETNEKMALVKSYPVITGKDSTPTPRGIFSLNSNDYDPKGIIMTGGYGQVTVYYWLGVVGNDIGIHDAPWRRNSEFLSVQGRSRGCINMIQNDIKELSSRVYVGTKILITN